MRGEGEGGFTFGGLKRVERVILGGGERVDSIRCVDALGTVSLG